ncbi:hypothetical protein L917_07945, partial [Phytophthora nicotianae]
VNLFQGQFCSAKRFLEMLDGPYYDSYDLTRRT